MLKVWQKENQEDVNWRVIERRTWLVNLVMQMMLSHRNTWMDLQLRVFIDTRAQCLNFLAQMKSFKIVWVFHSSKLNHAMQTTACMFDLTSMILSETCYVLLFVWEFSAAIRMTLNKVDRVASSVLFMLFYSMIVDCIFHVITRHDTFVWSHVMRRHKKPIVTLPATNIRLNHLFCTDFT